VVEISQELHWDKKISGVVLSSFYWGYALTQIIGGQLSDKHGGGVVLMSCGMGVGVAIILIPLVAMLSNHLVILSNLINGICQGMFFPAVISLLSSHVSDEEQNLFNGIIHSGPQLGSIFCGFLSYILLFRYGWEYIFVFVGVATILWACLMRMLMKGHHNKFHYQLVDSTSNNSSPSASGDKEKAIKVNLHKKETSCVQLPWRYIIKEPPVLLVLNSLSLQVH
jgi:ACS family sodium-dependent inorganic phosphate cotransporter-like MFS transporter 9